MEQVVIDQELLKYVESEYMVDVKEIKELTFNNKYSVVISKNIFEQRAMVTLFYGIQKLGNLLYFKNNEDLNVFLRETLERK